MGRGGAGSLALQQHRERQWRSVHVNDLCTLTISARWSVRKTKEKAPNGRGSSHPPRRVLARFTRRSPNIKCIKSVCHKLRVKAVSTARSVSRDCLSEVSLCGSYDETWQQFNPRTEARSSFSLSSSITAGAGALNCYFKTKNTAKQIK